MKKEKEKEEYVFARICIKYEISNVLYVYIVIRVLHIYALLSNLSSLVEIIAWKSHAIH